MSAVAPLVFGFVLTLVRTAALVGSAPILSSHVIPARIKVALAAVVAFVSFTAAGLPHVPVAGVASVVGLVISELALGLAAGLSGRLLLDAAQVGGQTASTALGFGFGQVLNPMSNAESTQVGEIFSILAMGTAVALGVHREAIGWIARSVVEVPPGATADLGALGLGLVRQAILGVTLAVRVAYPLLAAAVLGYGVMGLMGKAAPQLSLSNLGFAVSILMGGGAVYLVAPDLARVCAEASLRVFGR